MVLKPGVTVVGCKKQLLAMAIQQIEPIYRDLGLDMIITHGYGQGRGHLRGDALDLRVYEGSDQEHLTAALRRSLGPKYRVVLEEDHIHVERLLQDNRNGL